MCDRVLHMPQILNFPAFRICQGSVYTSFKYVRVTQGSKYAWIFPGYVWLRLNVSKFVWIAFALHLSIVIPYLKEPETVFLESNDLISSIVSRSIWFCFLFLDWIFLQVRFQICSYLWGPKGPGALNLTQPMR